MPESADWYNSGFLILWGSNVPQTRTPDAHFYTEVRYKGAKSVVICPDYSEASKFADLWISVKQGTDAALAMAMGHVILREFHIDRQAQYFEDYARQYTDMPMLVRLVKQGDHLVPDRLLRASDFADNLGETNNPEWKTVAYDETSGEHRGAATARSASAGARRANGTWRRRRPSGRDTNLQLTLRRRQGRARRRRLPLLRQPRARPLRRHRPSERAGAQRAGQARAAQGRRGAGRLRVRPVRRQLRRRPRLRRRACRQVLRRQRALHAGLGREDHRRAARPDHPGGARVRPQRREDQGPLHGDHRRGHEPLVPLRHELPRRHQHAGDVRLRRPVGRRLVALRRPGEAAARSRAGCRSPSRSTGAARRGSRTPPRSSTPTPTSGATRRSTSARSSRRPRRLGPGTGR